MKPPKVRRVRCLACGMEAAIIWEHQHAESIRELLSQAALEHQRENPTHSTIQEFT